MPPPDGRSQLAHFGGYNAFTEHFQFLVAGGHSIVWTLGTYTHLAAWNTGCMARSYERAIVMWKF